MLKYAVINTTTNIVENVIVWDGVSDWTPPENHVAVNVEGIIVGPKWTSNNDGSFTAPESTPTTEELLISVRDRRDTLLTQSDILVLPDRWATYTTEKQTALSTYRQALRDITTQSDLSNIAWPTLPT